MNKARTCWVLVALAIVMTANADLEAVEIASEDLSDFDLLLVELGEKSTGQFKSRLGLCIQAKTGVNQGAHLWACKKSSRKQLFDYNHGANRIVKQGFCLDSESLDVEGSLVKMTACDDSNTQWWTYDAYSGQIRNSRGFCVSAAESNAGKLSIMKCAEENLDMQFDFKATQTEKKSGGKSSDSRKPIDCVVGEWSPYTPCTHTCGGGLKKRTRVVIQTPKYGGLRCSHLMQTLTCGTNPCPTASPCQVTEWSDFSVCSVSCGGGKQTRTRTVVKLEAPGGVGCPLLSEDRICNTHGCNPATIKTRAAAAADQAEKVVKSAIREVDAYTLAAEKCNS